MEHLHQIVEEWSGERYRVSEEGLVWARCAKCARWVPASEVKTYEARLNAPEARVAYVVYLTIRHEDGTDMFGRTRFVEEVEDGYEHYVAEEQHVERTVCRDRRACEAATPEDERTPRRSAYGAGRYEEF